MTSPLLSVVSVVVLQFSLLRNANAVTCYGFGGQAYPDNLICPGSNACCGATATCLSNRLCHNEGDNNDTFVRGPCALQPYSKDSCAEICLYNETTGFLPRVSVCADGSFCCDEIPNCCEAGQGVFLDSTGEIVASLPSTSSSKQASTSPTTSSATLATTLSTTSSPSPSALSNSQMSSPSATSSPASSTTSSPGLGTGAKAGIGVGVAFGVLIIIVLVILVWIQQRRLQQTRPEATTDNLLPFVGTQQLSNLQTAPKEIDSQYSPIVAELPAHRG